MAPPPRPAVLPVKAERAPFTVTLPPRLTMAPPVPAVWLPRNVVPDTVVVPSEPLLMAPPPGETERPRLPVKALLVMVRAAARAFWIAPPSFPGWRGNVWAVRLTVPARL